MAFQIIRNDITQTEADVIVNTANPAPTYEAGVDRAIYKAAGEKDLLSERRKIGKIATGELAVTSAFGLQAKYIIHVVGPVWIDGEHGEQDILRSCYLKALKKAEFLKCKSIAFPVISSGIYGFPKDVALQIATSTLQEFSMHHSIDITLVVFDKESYELCGNVFKNIETYVDENYVVDASITYYHNHVRELEHMRDMRFERRKAMERRRQQQLEFSLSEITFDEDELVADDQKTFQEKLFEYIDKTGMKDSAFYKPLQISRQMFSKIRCNKYYQPSRETAIVFCISLKLDEKQTVDLLSRAGFALMPNSKFDLVIKACILHKQYNFKEINDYLEKLQLPYLIHKEEDDPDQKDKLKKSNTKKINPNKKKTGSL